MTRKYCPNCEKAIAACFCHKLAKYSIDSHIIILRHPTEKGHPLGTAKIAELSLDNCKVFTGENFIDHQELNKILKDEDCYLVFPTDQTNSIVEKTTHKRNKTFIFLDGTWKKAKKILYTNPQLEKLPKLSLTPSLPSNYILRKEPKPNYVSTLEAICECIKIYEQKDISNTLNTLKYIQDFQIDKMGKDNFNLFYLKD